MKFLVTYATYEDDPEYTYYNDCKTQLFQSHDSAVEWLKMGVPSGKHVKVTFDIHRINKNGSTVMVTTGNIDYRNDPIFQMRYV